MAVSRLTQTTLQNGFEKYNQLWDGRSAVGSMEAISSITLSAAQANVEFNNIPGTYSHLQLRSFSMAANWILMTVNGVTTSGNYRGHELRGDGASVTSTEMGQFSTAQMWISIGASSSYGNVAITDILDYTNTNKYKTIRSIGGQDANGSGKVEFVSNVFLSTNAITSITLSIQGASLGTYSNFSLYGIK